MTSSQIIKAYTQDAEFYDSERFESKVGRFYYELEKSRILKWLKGSKVLELGCGTGRYAIPFTRLGFDYIGIDITPAMLEVARKKAKKEHLNLKLLKMDAHNLKFEKNTFDSVFCDRTFKFLQPIKVLREVYRVLKPNGIIIIDTEAKLLIANKLPFIDTINFIITSKSHTGHLGSTPEKRYSKEEIKAMFKLAKFRILEIESIVALPMLVTWLTPTPLLRYLSKIEDCLEKIRGAKILVVGQKGVG